MREPSEDYDAVYLHSKRETIVLLVVFSVFLVWVISVSWWSGYGQDPARPLRTVWGIPHWVFWGVALPWMAANLFTLVFSWRVVANDPLDQPVDGEPPEERSV